MRKSPTSTALAQPHLANADHNINLRLMLIHPHCCYSIASATIQRSSRGGSCERRRRMAMQRSDSSKECFPQPREALDEQGSLLDSVIRFTFDTLNAQHLDLRIVAETR